MENMTHKDLLFNIKSTRFLKALYLLGAIFLAILFMAKFQNLIDTFEPVWPIFLILFHIQAFLIVRFLYLSEKYKRLTGMLK